MTRYFPLRKTLPIVTFMFFLCQSSAWAGVDFALSSKEALSKDPYSNEYIAARTQIGDALRETFAGLYQGRFVLEQAFAAASEVDALFADPEEAFIFLKGLDPEDEGAALLVELVDRVQLTPTGNLALHLKQGPRGEGPTILTLRHPRHVEAAEPAERQVVSRFRQGLSSERSRALDGDGVAAGRQPVGTWWLHRPFNFSSEAKEERLVLRLRAIGRRIAALRPSLGDQEAVRSYAFGVSDHLRRYESGTSGTYTEQPDKDGVARLVEEWRDLTFSDHARAGRGRILALAGRASYRDIPRYREISPSDDEPYTDVLEEEPALAALRRLPRAEVTRVLTAVLNGTDTDPDDVLSDRGARGLLEKLGYADSAGDGIENGDSALGLLELRSAVEGAGVSFWLADPRQDSRRTGFYPGPGGNAEKPILLVSAGSGTSGSRLLQLALGIDLESVGPRMREKAQAALDQLRALSPAESAGDGVTAAVSTQEPDELLARLTELDGEIYRASQSHPALSDARARLAAFIAELHGMGVSVSDVHLEQMPPYIDQALVGTARAYGSALPVLLDAPILRQARQQPVRLDTAAQGYRRVVAILEERVRGYAARRAREVSGDGISFAFHVPEAWTGKTTQPGQSQYSGSGSNLFGAIRSLPASIYHGPNRVITDKSRRLVPGSRMTLRVATEENLEEMGWNQIESGVWVLDITQEHFKHAPESGLPWNIDEIDVIFQDPRRLALREAWEHLRQGPRPGVLIDENRSRAVILPLSAPLIYNIDGRADEDTESRFSESQALADEIRRALLNASSTHRWSSEVRTHETSQGESLVRRVGLVGMSRDPLSNDETLKAVAGLIRGWLLDDRDTVAQLGGQSPGHGFILPFLSGAYQGDGISSESVLQTGEIQGVLIGHGVDLLFADSEGVEPVPESTFDSAASRIVLSIGGASSSQAVLRETLSALNPERLSEDDRSRAAQLKEALLDIVRRHSGAIIAASQPTGDGVDNPEVARLRVQIAELEERWQTEALGDVNSPLYVELGELEATLQALQALDVAPQRQPRRDPVAPPIQQRARGVVPVGDDISGRTPRDDDDLWGDGLSDPSGRFTLTQPAEIAPQIPYSSILADLEREMATAGLSGETTQAPDTTPLVFAGAVNMSAIPQGAIYVHLSDEAGLEARFVKDEGRIVVPQRVWRTGGGLVDLEAVDLVVRQATRGSLSLALFLPSEAAPGALQWVPGIAVPNGLSYRIEQLVNALAPELGLDETSRRVLEAVLRAFSSQA